MRTTGLSALRGASYRGQRLLATPGQQRHQQASVAPFSSSSVLQSVSGASTSTTFCPSTLASHPSQAFSAIPCANPRSRNADSARTTEVQRKLARIEATKGAVSPYLRDTFAREHDYLRISLTEKCNLRCTYCMPEEGAPLSPKEHLLSSDEVLKLASVFVKNGVRKVRLTGGEPTIRRDLVRIVEGLSALGLESIGMTSNGIALSRKLPDLVQAGLTHLNISLDTLDPLKFELMTRRRGHATVLKAIRQATELMSSSSPGQKALNSVKLNVVVINKLNSEEVLPFVELTKDLPIGVRFIEYMPFDGNKWSTNKMVPSSALLSRIEAGSTPGSVRPISPEPSDTARIYRRDGHAGTFGFISSMTDHFCSGCSRLRLGADGSMKVCLFGEPTLSLRDLLRNGASDLQLSEAVGKAVKGKKFAHDGKSVYETGKYSSSILPNRRLSVYHASTHKRNATRTLVASGAVTLPAIRTGAGIRLFGTSSRFQSRTGKLPRLTHISEATGKPAMVSVTGKDQTVRSATAVGKVVINKAAYDLLDSTSNSNATSRKGDVLTVAQLAGIMGSKRTADLIPLCHPLNLSNVQVQLQVTSPTEGHSFSIMVTATAECMGPTGVEMEALTAVNVACLTVWDMLKAVAGKEMLIEGIKVIRKSGGKSGDWEREFE